MTGKQLFEQKTVRDFSGNEADLYAQELMSIFMHVGTDLFPLLEEAEATNKKVEIKQIKDEILIDDIIISDLILV